MKCHWRFKNHSTCRVKHGELCEKVLAHHSAPQAPDLAPDWYLAVTSGTTTPPPQLAAPIGTGASYTRSPQNLEQHQAGADQSSRGRAQEEPIFGSGTVFPRTGPFGRDPPQTRWTLPPEGTTFRQRPDGSWPSSREQLYARQMAEQANVYDSVYEAMRALFCIVNKLSIAELTHLSAICQTADDHRRVLRHTMSGNDKATWTSAHYAKIQSELKSLCLAMLELLDQKLIPQAMHDDTIAAYTKLRAEFRRCLAETMRSEVKVAGACPAHSRDPLGRTPLSANDP